MSEGEYLFRHQEASDAAFVLLRGELEIRAPALSAQTMCLRTLRAGDLAGEMGAFTGRARSADACVTVAIRAWRIPRDAIVAALEADGRAAMALVSALAAQLNASDEAARRSHWQGVSARLARRLAEAPGGVVTDTQSEIARQIGASREAVNRRLAQWRRAGWIAYDRSGLRIVASEALLRSTLV